MIHYGEVLNPLDFGGARFPVLFVADGRFGRDDPAREVEAAGGRLLERQPWSAIVARPAMPRDVVLLADARGVDADAIDTAMPWFEDLDANGTGGVLLIDPDQIDGVAAPLLASRFGVLCDASAAERAAALALAYHGAGGEILLHDSSRASEADRLRRLDEEVARIAGVLVRLSRPAAEAPPISEPRTSFAAQPAPPEEEAATAQAVRKAIRARRLRDQLFESGLFEDPAWDILLDLFAARLEHGRLSVSSLCIAAAVAPTTALRWISRMTAIDLLRREPDPFDRRRAFIGLTDRAHEGMRSYCRTVQAQGLAIA